MTVPSQADLKKREDKHKRFLKRLTPTGHPQEKHVISVVRSAIRQAWMKSDTKLAFMYSKTIPDMDDSTRTKWLYKCEICGNMFKQNEIEIDHKQGHKSSFTKPSEFEEYFNNILMVGFDDLQVLCKDGCHPIKTLSESLGITFEEAKIEKEVISICKLPAKKIDDWLAENGINCAKNKDARRDAVRGVLMKQEKSK